MTTRTINIALVEQVPAARVVRFIPDLSRVGGTILLHKLYTTTTAADGTGSIALPVKDTGTIRYKYELPTSVLNVRSKGWFYLSAGAPIDLADLIAAGGAASDSIVEYIEKRLADLNVVAATEAIEIVCGDRLTPLVVATNVGSRRMPFPFTLSGIRASLDVAQASGSLFTINVKENGTTVLSTRITIDNGELTSVSAATPAVISDTGLADDALVSVDVTQVGSGDASGLVVQLIGTKANA